MEFEISGFCSVLDAYAEIASQIKYISIIVGDFFYQTLREFRKFKKKKKMYGRAGLHRLRKLKLWNHSQWESLSQNSNPHLASMPGSKEQNTAYGFRIINAPSCNNSQRKIKFINWCWFTKQRHREILLQTSLSIFTTNNHLRMDTETTIFFFYLIQR